MAELTQADRYLLDRISRGDEAAWAQLVERYQGRLLAFARGKLNRKDEAEDLVQDTFIAFLEGLKRFRENASVETFLFTILRHKIIDFFRGKQMRVCFIQEVMEGRSSGEPDRPMSLADSQQPTASWYARKDEQDQSLRDALSDALDELTERLRKSENFRDLQIIEMLFYAQIRNKDAASVLGMDEKQIALIKHRALREIREQVVARGTVSKSEAPMIDTPAWEASAQSASLLSEVWERQRPTCPKRSTLGRYVLGTLEPAWQTYVDFHVNKLGCVFCRANLDDLKKQSEEQPRALHSRVLQSTVGFFRQT